MSELHLPLSSYNNKSNNMISLLNSSLGHWDQYFHGLGVLNDTESMSLVMEDVNYSTPTLFSSSLICGEEEEEDHSSGYLEDALFEFTERSKRRRLFKFGDEKDDETEFLHHKSSSRWELAQDFSFVTENEMTGYNEFSDGNITTSFGSDPVIKKVSEILDSSASSSSYKDTANYDHQFIDMSCRETIFSVDPLDSDEKTSTKKFVYPFTVVKPGGKEGDLTLNDINERILMPPTRPVRHPVGDFACRPNCVSPYGPGLSGKAVVALTRIQTRGRGTITIIRTKG